ncbi:MAG: hypothetical protein ABGY41_08650 [Candidatus Poribacteria bacterium]
MIAGIARLCGIDHVEDNHGDGDARRSNDFESFSALERYVKDAGRQWQRDLCSRLANEKGVEVSEVACLHCGSPETIR